jgi:two-component system OmpR family sensor kinase
MSSIRKWLLGWLIFGLAAASIVAGYTIFKTAHAEAGELFDYELRTVARSLPTELAGPANSDSSAPNFAGLADDRLVIDIWDAAQGLVYHSPGQPELPRFFAGISSILFGDQRWRVFGSEQRGRFIQVAQPYSVREGLALRLAWRTLWPLALLVPVTLALVLFLVARGLAPIRSVSNTLSTRSADSLQPVDVPDELPIEIRPLVDALNDLLRRLGTASQAQQAFIADAAHELRSPLTALKLQFQAAVRDGSLAGDVRTFERLENRLNRTIHLAQQLLTLAREDASSDLLARATNLRFIAEQAVGDFSLMAESKGVDLGLEFDSGMSESETYPVRGDPYSLGILLSNLIDNAIRYTPAGGKIDVVLWRRASVAGFDVLDSGPGIADEEIQRVINRFYRSVNVQGTGSGLGLAIAARIVQRHGATLAIKNRLGGGLSVSVSGLPIRDTPPAA